MFSKTLQTHSYPHSVLTWEVIGAMLRKETPSVSFRVNSFNLQQIQMKQEITGVGVGWTKKMSAQRHSGRRRYWSLDGNPRKWMETVVQNTAKELPENEKEWKEMLTKQSLCAYRSGKNSFHIEQTLTLSWNAFPPTWRYSVRAKSNKVWHELEWNGRMSFTCLISYNKPSLWWVHFRLVARIYTAVMNWFWSVRAPAPITLIRLLLGSY